MMNTLSLSFIILILFILTFITVVTRLLLAPVIAFTLPSRE